MYQELVEIISPQRKIVQEIKPVEVILFTLFLSLHTNLLIQTTRRKLKLWSLGARNQVPDPAHITPLHPVMALAPALACLLLLANKRVDIKMLLSSPSSESPTTTRSETWITFFSVSSFVGCRLNLCFIDHLLNQ